MSDTGIEIRVEEVDGNLIFTSNKKIEGENISYDLNSVKEIFELNPIAEIDLCGEHGSRKISFDIKYDASQSLFLACMYLNGDEIDSEVLTLIDMLNILTDAYLKNTYISSNQILTSKTSKMLNNHVFELLKEGDVPKMKFMLQGIGEVLEGNKKVALFNRIVINPANNNILLCESVGDMPLYTNLKVKIKTDIGVTIEMNNMFADTNVAKGIMDINYVEMSMNNSFNLVDKMELSRNKEFDFNEELITVSSHDILSRTIPTAIGICIQELNKNDSDTLISFARSKKDVLFENENEEYLLDQVDDLFDDLF